MWQMLSALVASAFRACGHAFDRPIFNLLNFLFKWITGTAPALYVNAIQASNLAGTYANGTLGVGATLTKASAGALGTIDGVTPEYGTLVLLTAQTTGYQNGLYSVTNLGSATVPWVLTRFAAWDASAEMKNGSAFYVTAGTVYAGQVWAYTGVNSPTVGTTTLTFTRDYILRSSSSLNAGIPVFGAVVKTATTLLISTGVAAVYDNGVAGVGATLTAASNAAIGTIGGVALTSADVGKVILIADQVSALENGLYTLTAAGAGGVSKWVLTRLPGMDAVIKDGTIVAIQTGTYAGVLYEQTATVDVVGTDSVTFAVASTGVTFAAVKTALAAANSAVDFNGQAITGATGQTGTPSATSAPAFTGTASTAAEALAFNGTGFATVGQVVTTTDNQTMLVNACANMWLITATQAPCLIISNTAVTGAPAVLTVYGLAPTTDAGTYKILKSPTPVGTVAAVPTTTHTHAQS